MTELFSLWAESLPQLLLATITVTIPLSIIAFILALVVAVLATSMRMGRVKPLQWISRFYVWLFRGTPILVSHGLALQAALCDLLAVPFDDAWADGRYAHRNTAVTELEGEAGHWRVVRVADGERRVEQVDARPADHAGGHEVAGEAPPRVGRGEPVRHLEISPRLGRGGEAVHRLPAVRAEAHLHLVDLAVARHAVGSVRRFLLQAGLQAERYAVQRRDPVIADDRKRA